MFLFLELLRTNGSDDFTDNKRIRKDDENGQNINLDSLCNYIIRHYAGGIAIACFDNMIVIHKLSHPFPNNP